jgi:uncharacterized membrane protein SpoIIM required for sporulation
LDALYRKTTVHLARVSTRSNDQVLLDYLNRLTAAAHSVIYLPPRQSIASRIGEFVMEGFARTIARNWRPILLSSALLIGGALVGYFAAVADPVLCHALWPSQDPRQPGSSSEQLLSHLRQGREDSGGMKFLFSSFLFQHNFRVAVLALATGLLAGVPTVFLMIFNGMILGVFVAIHHQAGISAEMWAWILPHGVTELGAIALCGGVGLMLGRAVVSPGPLSRTQSLLNTGREASMICIGAAGMLVAAALIEGYIRQTSWPTEARLAFAASTAVFWATYIALGVYRERQANRVARPEGLAKGVAAL